jgi:hypothetical protein
VEAGAAVIGPRRIFKPWTRRTSWLTWGFHLDRFGVKLYVGRLACGIDWLEITVRG